MLTADATLKIRATKAIIATLVATQPPVTVTSSAQFKDQKGFGKRTLERIDMWLKTGTWPELKAPHSPVLASGAAVPPTSPPMTLRRDETLVSLQAITGVGPVKAKKLADLGATVDILQAAVRTNNEDALLPFGLTHHQRLGVKYLEDTKRRVPRAVIARFEAFLGSGRPTDTCGLYVARIAVTSRTPATLTFWSHTPSGQRTTKHRRACERLSTTCARPSG